MTRGRTRGPATITVRVACTIALAVCASCAAPDLRTYHDTLAENGFVTVFRPPHGGMNAGVVLYGARSGSQLTVGRIICPDGLFAGVQIREAPVGLANFEGKNEVDFNLALSILKKVLGEEISAKLEAKRKGTTKVTFAAATEAFLSDSSIYDGGGIRELRPDCHAALKALKARGEYDDRVFVLTNVVRSKIKYEFDLETSGKVDASGAPLRAILNASAGTHWKTDGKTTLMVDAPLFLAARSPVLLKEFVPEGLVSGGFARVEFSRTGITRISGQ